MNAQELPIAGQPPVRERADAARNRARVLEAAERLFAEHGVEGVTLDDVVAAAGVGKGTLYRRFGDKSGLAVALLDEREKQLQQRILTGPPPLGPDAPPAERLSAFVAAYVDYAARYLDLVLMSETASPNARLRSGVQAFWRTHIAHLLTTAGAADPQLRAEVLLAALSAEQLTHWLRTNGVSLDGLVAALCRTAATFLTPGSNTR